MKTNWIEHVLKLHEQNYGTHHTALAREELAEIERQAVADAGEAFELCEENKRLRAAMECLVNTCCGTPVNKTDQFRKAQAALRGKEEK